MEVVVCPVRLYDDSQHLRTGKVTREKELVSLHGLREWELPCYEREIEVYLVEAQSKRWIECPNNTK